METSLGCLKRSDLGGYQGLAGSSRGVPGFVLQKRAIAETHGGRNRSGSLEKVHLGAGEMPQQLRLRAPAALPETGVGCLAPMAGVSQPPVTQLQGNRCPGPPRTHVNVPICRHIHLHITKKELKK